MPDVTITTASTGETFDGFEVMDDVESRAFSAELSPVGTLNLLGDEQPVAAPLRVRIWPEGPTFSERAFEAYRVKDLGVAATSVTTPRGTRTVDGLLSWRIGAQGVSVWIVLEFAPLESDYS